MATKKQKTKVENREPNDAVNVGKKDIRKDHILVVEDDTAELETLAEVLVADDREIHTAQTGEYGAKLLDKLDIDLLITDLMLPGKTDGLDLLRKARKNEKKTGVILVTGHGSVDTAIEAMKEGAHDYLTKPVDIRRLRAVAEKALEVAHIARRHKELEEAIAVESGFMGIIGESPAMKTVFERIRAAAPIDSTVLITGESGTGKELVADAIHELSNRAEGPLVKVNCSAIPESLMESELFGHEKGSFTGASDSRPGKFELSTGGTIVLDEIGDIPLKLQPKLLRVLENSTVERIGGRESKKLDLRVVSSTNRDLDKAVEENEFRQDLLYRIRVVTINLPPLRERKEDIPLLIERFLARLSVRLGRKLEGISKEALDIFMDYDWPGNVRELKHALEQMAIFSAEPVLSNVPETISGKKVFKVGSLAGVPIKDLEKQAIMQTLKDVGGDKKQAAQVLGIGLRTLYRKLEEYGE
ncbi:sigma-54-dependent Fis family transcriptional regulator [bacterium]|nr:MAG: sigma-54-dependent Fis family transcriptional regulator [bacterium]